MRFSKHQTRARPSQGGPFHQPVTPPLSTQLAAVCAERYAFQSYAEASPRTPLAPPVSNGVQALVKCFGCGHVVEREHASLDPAGRTWWCGPCATIRAAMGKIKPAAAPPVDEELERERARLVGKRVRHAERRAEYVVDWVKRRDDGNIIAHEEGSSSSSCDWAYNLEPIPEEKPRECRFCDLEVGEWFVWSHHAGGGRGQKVDRERANVIITGNVASATYISADLRVCRIDGPSA